MPARPSSRYGAALAQAAFAAAALALALLAPQVARADWEEDVRGLYGRFLEAQNARDLARVRTLLLDSEDFLWVSDGQSFWGPDTLVERMKLFQKAAVWHVTPDLEHAMAVPVGADAAFLHLPLVLEIVRRGPGPDRLRFLVSVLGSRQPDGWRTAALFTTTEKVR